MVQQSIGGCLLVLEGTLVGRFDQRVKTPTLRGPAAVDMHGNSHHAA
jgi:hypothetical protein